MRAKVMYNFSAQPGSAELTIYEGETLTILSKDVGAGWWEGENEHGDRGLFPATYVEPCDVSSPQAPANTYQQQQQQQPQQQVVDGQFLASPNLAQFKPPGTSAEAGQTAEEPDWPDEDWDDEDDSGDNATEYGGSQAGARGGFPIGAPYYSASVSSAGATAGQQVAPGDLSIATTNLSITDNRDQAGAGPARTKKNFNRFSNFVKSGLESYILSETTMNVSPEDAVHIEYDPELGVIWRPHYRMHTCAVTKHGKESKMKGLKTYISYDVTPSINNEIVRRRYKHFDWLMQRLEEKFLFTPIPPLPEKQIAGRFQEDFVEHRRNLLQLWVNYITRHPVLSNCKVWWHFITCSTDDMKGWKFGKRKAEKDELVGANFFYSVKVDTKKCLPALDPVKTSKQNENFQRFVAKLDEAVKHMFTTTVDQSKKFSTVYAKDYKKLSESIKELSSAFQCGTAWRNSLPLNEAIRQTSAAYEDVCRLYEEEPKFDFEPMADVLHQYRGLLASWPDILQLHKNTVNNRYEQERLFEEGKIGRNAIEKVYHKSDVTTLTLLAEINHFHNERIVDFKQMLQVFLAAQINFHSEIVEKLKSAQNKINDA